MNCGNSRMFHQKGVSKLMATISRVLKILVWKNILTSELSLVVTKLVTYLYRLTWVGASCLYHGTRFLNG